MSSEYQLSFGKTFGQIELRHSPILFKHYQRKLGFPFSSRGKPIRDLDLVQQAPFIIQRSSPWGQSSKKDEKCKLKYYLC